MALVIREPSSLVQVNDQCAAVEAWADTCESVPELKDANNKLAAIDEYLSRTSTEGRSRVAAAMRRLEVRIGALLGPAVIGRNQHTGGLPTVQDLNDAEKHRLRKMAANADIVEDVIANSSDQSPATAKKVLTRINGSRPATSSVRRAKTKADERLVDDALSALTGAASVLDGIDPESVDDGQAVAWMADLSDVLRSLRRFHNVLATRKVTA